MCDVTLPWFQERLATTQGELEQSNVEYDKLKREAIAKQEADRNAIRDLESELKGAKELHDETW